MGTVEAKFVFQIDKLCVCDWTKIEMIDFSLVEKITRMEEMTAGEAIGAVGPQLKNDWVKNSNEVISDWGKIRPDQINCQMHNLRSSETTGE